MLALHIITVGRDKEKWVTEQSEHYIKLIRKYASVELTSVPEEKYGKNFGLTRALRSEADRIEARLKGGLLVTLDIGGKALTTESFALKLSDWQTGGVSRIEFVIGGPYGLDPGLKSRADFNLSLSPLAMSHQIVRVVLLEQLYRTLNINAGGSYHK